MLICFNYYRCHALTSIIHIIYIFNWNWICSVVNFIVLYFYACAYSWIFLSTCWHTWLINDIKLLSKYQSYIFNIYTYIRTRAHAHAHARARAHARTHIYTHTCIHIMFDKDTLYELVSLISCLYPLRDMKKNPFDMIPTFDG